MSSNHNDRPKALLPAPSEMEPEQDTQWQTYRLLDKLRLEETPRTGANAGAWISVASKDSLVDVER